MLFSAVDLRAASVHLLRAARKLADLVILDKRPPKGREPMAIKDIKVVETIKEGKTIYQAP